MIILKQESGYADVNDNSFLKVNLDPLYSIIVIIMPTLHNNSYWQVNFQMEQGLPLVPKSLTFNRVKCAVSKGIKLGPTFLVTR
jgi:hypothetical protein